MTERLLRILALSLVVLLAVGCGTADGTTTDVTAESADAGTETDSPSQAADDEAITISLLTSWGPAVPQGPPLVQIIEAFEAEYPGINVEVEVVPVNDDIPTLLETAFLAGEEQDIVMYNLVAESTVWEEDGLTISLSPYIAEWGIEDQLLDHAIKEYTINGELVAVPLGGFNWPMWYNMEILNASGVETPPQTWEELKETAQAVRDAGYQPFALGGKDWTGADWLMTAFVAALPPAEAEQLFTAGGFSESANARAFVEEFVELRDSGVFVDDAEGLEFSSMNAMFFGSNAAMMHGGSWSYAEAPPELAEHVILEGIPVPPNAEGASEPFWYSSFGSMGVWVTRNGTEKIEPVGEFIQYMYRPENIALFVEQGALISPLRDVDYDESQVPPLFAQSLEIDVEAVDHPTIWIPAQIYGDPIYNITANAFIPGASADEILEDLDNLWSQVN